MYADIDSADDAVTKDNADHKDKINDAADSADTTTTITSVTTTSITPSVTRMPKASTLANVHESSEEVIRA